MTKSMANFLFPFLCLMLSLLFPAACSAGVRRGLALVGTAALPALFPSLVLSNLITRALKGRNRKACLLLPFFLGLLCGFPIGAKTVSDMVSRGKISKKDGEKLLFFCNNAGASFLLSHCGVNVLHDKKKALALFLFQAATATAFLLIFFGKELAKKEVKTTKDAVENTASILQSIPLSLRESANSFLYIIACILFFSFFSAVIRSVLPLKKSAFSVLALLLEVTGGLSALEGLPQKQIFPLCAFGCGFGGFSVYLQTAGVLEESGLSAKSYLQGKLLFSFLLGLAAFFLQKYL